MLKPLVVTFTLLGPMASGEADALQASVREEAQQEKGSFPAEPGTTRYLRLQAFFSALAFGLGLLHLILFFALPRVRSNLYYAIYLFLFSAAVFVDFQHFLTGGLMELRVFGVLVSLAMFFYLMFFYELFLPPQPWLAWPIGAGLLLAAVSAGADLPGGTGAFRAMLLVVFVEGLRTLYRAIRERRTGALTMTVGYGLAALCVSYDWLVGLQMIRPVFSMEKGYLFGVLPLIIAGSVNLARGVAHTQDEMLSQERRLHEKEVERLVLDAEMTRKTQELREARDLQLSMLPKAPSEVVGLEVAALMRTATEVGGDYYDFRQGADGELILAIGDATGHGLRAGILVAVTKSLFRAIEVEWDLTRFFERSTRVLKQMRFKGLFMALTLARVRDGVLTVAAAGMPPVLIHRAADGSLEEILLRGMPLGAVHGFPYRQREALLSPGDTVLLMSDGFPELFNARREMLGWDRAKACFTEAASGSPDEILDELAGAAESWRGEQPQEDDITFVALRAT